MLSVFVVGGNVRCPTCNKRMPLKDWTDAEQREVLLTPCILSTEDSIEVKEEKATRVLCHGIPVDLRAPHWLNDVEICNVLMIITDVNDARALTLAEARVSSVN